MSSTKLTQSILSYYKMVLQCRASGNAVALYPALLTPNENKIETMFLVVYIHVIQCWVTQNLRFFFRLLAVLFITCGHSITLSSLPTSMSASQIWPLCSTAFPKKKKKKKYIYGVHNKSKQTTVVEFRLMSNQRRATGENARRWLDMSRRWRR